MNWVRVLGVKVGLGVVGFEYYYINLYKFLRFFVCMARQYEQSDCSEEAQEGQRLQIAKTILPANEGGECDSVLVFGNPETKKISWVPYGSKFSLDSEIYIVIRGERGGNPRREDVNYDQSLKCIVDNEDNLYSMWDEKFHMKHVEIVELGDGSEKSLEKRLK